MNLILVYWDKLALQPNLFQARRPSGKSDERKRTATCVSSGWAGGGGQCREGKKRKSGGKACDSDTALLGGRSCGQKTIKQSRETELKLTSNSAYLTEEQDLPEQNPRENQNWSASYIWQQLRRVFHAYGKGGVVWKREGSLPMVGEDHEEQVQIFPFTFL